VEGYPPYSPDFNPIELIWKILKDHVEKMNPKTIDELEECIRRAWDMITQEQIDNCINHTRRMINLCIETNG